MTDPKRIAYLLLGLVCLWPAVSSGTALLLGIVFAVAIGNPVAKQSKKWSGQFLQLAIIGLGAGMDLATVAKAGMHGILYTVVGITGTMILGLALGRWLKNSQSVSVLVSSGTAICGGSAIAAISSAIQAPEEEISVSLAAVFTLNALALFIFPPIGHALSLTETQFGIWAALAIHDTSSVVGAGLAYGPHALELATIIKLARAAWIIPMTFLAAALWKPAGAVAGKAKRPWFILGFVLMAALVSFVPVLRGPGDWVQAGAKRLMVFTLYLIGSGLPRNALTDPALRRVFAQAIVLWVLVGGLTLACIEWGILS